jgi:hypothetical protein
MLLRRASSPVAGRSWLSVCHAPARLSVFRYGVAITPSSYLQGRAGIRAWLPGAALMRRTEAWYSSIGSPPGAARRPGVRKAPLVAVATSHPAAGATVSPAMTICMCRFVHLQTNGTHLSGDEPRRSLPRADLVWKCVPESGRRSNARTRTRSVSKSPLRPAPTYGEMNTDGWRASMCSKTPWNVSGGVARVRRRSSGFASC